MKGMYIYVWDHVDFICHCFFESSVDRWWSLQPFCFPVWAWVNYGHSANLKKAADIKRDENHRQIIVSRSHAGPVETVAKKSFGDNTAVVPAGGAGMHVIGLCWSTLSILIAVVWAVHCKLICIPHTSLSKDSTFYFANHDFHCCSQQVWTIVNSVKPLNSYTHYKLLLIQWKASFIVILTGKQKIGWNEF